MSHVPWPDIESFHNVRRSVQKYPELLGGETVVQYHAKVKLHGTNAAVQLRGDRVIAQSRTQLIDKTNDNAGFAAWVALHEERWRGFSREFGPGHAILFGEWCGPGVNKGTAINQAPSKVFALFAALELPTADDSTLIVDPVVLMEIASHLPNTYALPWYGNPIDVPWLADAETAQTIVDTINADVDAVEACDPWVKDTFGIAGVGEGLVYYPTVPTRKRFSDLVFKAKGEKHRTIAKSAPAQIDPSVAASVDAFAALVLTDARLEQSARAAAGGAFTCEKRLMGPFLAWVGKDVEKETGAELAASGLTWKQVAKVVSDTARAWYLRKAEAL